MSKLLLDTDVLIDVLRGRDSTRVLLLDLTSRFVPCCSVISVAEIYAGMRPEEETATRTLLDGLVIIPVTGETAELRPLTFTSPPQRGRGRGNICHRHKDVCYSEVGIRRELFSLVLGWI